MPSRPRRRRSGGGKGRGGPPEPESSPVARALLQRGLAISECAAEDRTVLPYLSSPADRETLYGLLHSYAFRLFLRDILALRDRYRPERLGPFFTPESIDGMARQVERLGLIQRKAGGSIRFLAEAVTDFGETFEGMADGEVTRVEKETFSWERRIYLTYAKRDIVSNLSLCLRNYFLDRFFG